MNRISSSRSSRSNTPRARAVVVAPFLVAWFVSAPGCSGHVAEPAGGGDTQDPGGASPDGADVTGGNTLKAESAGPKPLRRLTRDEYNNTVRDLLGDSTAPAAAFADDVRGEGGFYSPNRVSGVETSAYRDAAETLASAAVQRTPALANCSGAEPICADAFIESFGRKAFRRPLSAVENQSLKALYTKVRAEPLKAPHKEAIQILIAAMLQAPQFLYHWEATSSARERDGSLVKLDGFEIASRLSYFLWSSMPDDELLSAAAAGELDSQSKVAEHAERLLADKRASSTVSSFFAQLLDLERVPGLVKDQSAYPAFNKDLAKAMVAEADAFVKYAVLDDGKYETLLTSPVSFINADLAMLYGKAGVSGAELRKTELNRDQRFGLLTQGAFLAGQANTYETSPVLRGKLVLTRLLCETVPPPPPDVDTSLGTPQPGQQTRERYESHSTNASCAGCHKTLDPFGFAFESYDGIGRYRTMDAGRPVRTDGKVSLPSGDISFSNAKELVSLIAKSPEGLGCMATQWLRFGLGRADDAADEGSRERALAAFKQAGGNFRELLLSIVKSKTFRYRALSEGEVL
ncbi:MAG: DUF1592 domain-containing protein [Deltaproteobacteria bacterium]|nr:DUF1592 domain-containing protein [Deltaproteobacteria bacterium]